MSLGGGLNGRPDMMLHGSMGLVSTGLTHMSPILVFGSYYMVSMSTFGKGDLFIWRLQVEAVRLCVG